MKVVCDCGKFTYEDASEILAAFALRLHKESCDEWKRIAQLREDGKL